jgi:hydrogenase maturation protein HypF
MLQRRAICVDGIVQGVGFRPFVHGLASRLRLRGFVRNQTGNVRIEVEGERASLDCFLDEVTRSFNDGNEAAPPLARIERVSWCDISVRGDMQFRIEASELDPDGRVLVSPDVATCADCLKELFDPANRRYRYPFLNCTHCGPRVTIITGSPYDRAQTTMAAFPMCASCREEYENPADRRFHAQPTCCPECGPILRLLDGVAALIPAVDPLATFVEEIRSGRIGAMKGIGGYHLVCDATNESAVAEMRRRKYRDDKPFAVMVRNFGDAQAICEVSSLERQLLESPPAPIVLLAKRTGLRIAPQVCDGVAPGNPHLGVMLPYSPLHHLLLDDMKGLPLVMTSGNRSDEPIAYDDADAITRLRGIADLFLIHNRPIHLRCDDSVTRVTESMGTGGKELPIRRSRGYSPQPVPLPIGCSRPTLAVGGQLKVTFALGRGQDAIISHHLGDLDHFAAYSAFLRDIDHFEQLFGVRPPRIAHDLHPDYASTQYAKKRAERTGVDLVAVQHHHAHMASCMAENGLTEPVIGVTFDGTGYGTDGAVWGGEFLVGDYNSFRRAAHLRNVGMPGGEQAIREPWRMAAAHLLDSDCPLTPLESLVPPASLNTVRTMIQRRLNAPPTSSIGRLFDAVAALIGLRQKVTYEGQAAVELQCLAEKASSCDSYPVEILEESRPGEPDPTFIADSRPMVRAILRDLEREPDRPRIARRFHLTIVEMIVDVCGRIREGNGLNRVVLSGGTFMNSLLTSEAERRLTGRGFVVYRHQLVPPNDGGLSLGQLAIAASRAWIGAGSTEQGARSGEHGPRSQRPVFLHAPCSLLHASGGS